MRARSKSASGRIWPAGLEFDTRDVGQLLMYICRDLQKKEIIRNYKCFSEFLDGGDIDSIVHYADKHNITYPNLNQVCSVAYT